MNVTEAIYSRHATRAYTPRPVDDATLDVPLHAAVQAPSAMNAQPWVFSVVQDRAQLRRCSDRAKTELLALGARDPNLPHYESRPYPSGASQPVPRAEPRIAFRSKPA